MPDPEGIPTPEELGAESTPVVEAETPPVTEPEKKPEPEVKQPEPEKEPEPEEEEVAQEFATVDELGDAVAKSIAAIEEKRAKQAAEAAEEADLSEDEKKIRTLSAENEQFRLEKEQAAIKATEDTIVHQVQSAAGKYKMTDPEVELIGEYFTNNPTLIGVWSFERAALYVLPELKGRLNGAPPAQPKPAPGSDTKAAGLIDATTGGPALPQPFKHDGRRRDYSDITRNAIASGEAAKLGSFK